MNKNIASVAIVKAGSMAVFLTASVMLAVHLSFAHPGAAALTLASLLLLPGVKLMLANCRVAAHKLRHRRDVNHITRKAIAYFSFAFFFFTFLQIRLSVLPSLTQPSGTLLLPAALLFSVVQALFMGLIGVRKVLLDSLTEATR